MNPKAPSPTAEELKPFCEAYGIVKLAVFGSVLREDFGPDSDVDVLVKFGPAVRISLRERLQTQDDLSPFFGGRTIDLVTADSLVHYIRDRIIAEAAQLYPVRKPPKQQPLVVDDDTALRLMRDRANRATELAAGRTRQNLDGDQTLNELLCYAVQRLGVHASGASEAGRKQLPGIDFEALQTLARHLIDERDTIDLDRLWAAATEICPSVIAQLDAFLPPDDERPGVYRGEPLDW